MTKELLKKATPIFMAVLVLSSILLVVLSQRDTEKILDEVNRSEKRTLSYLADFVEVEFSHIASDLNTIRKHHELQEFFVETSVKIVKDIGLDWSAVVENRMLLDQIRFIDNEGQEQIRVNNVNGQSQLVSQEELQNKKDRYYFQESISLPFDEIYVSELDLNVENGEVEKPIKPMIRFGGTVQDRAHKKRGVIVLNVLASKIFDTVRKKVNHLSIGNVMMVNSGGYWLMHPESNKEWGFMFGQDTRLAKDFPSEWPQIKAEHGGQILSENGLFTFTKISPLPESLLSKTLGVSVDTPSWTLLTHVPQNTLDNYLFQTKSHYLMVWLFVNIAALVATFYAATGKVASEQVVAQIKEREKRFDQILNSTEEGIYGVDSNGLCVFFNKSAEKLLGYSADEVVGKNTHKYFALKDKGEILQDVDSCLLNVALREGSPVERDDWTLYQKNGDLLNISCHIHPIERNGRVEGAVVTFTDISEKKKLITQKIRSGQLNALGELAAGVAHEINNPINGVINYAQIILNRYAEDETEKKIVNGIIKEGDRVASIVQKLLKFAHKDQTELAAHNINIIVEESLALMQTQLNKDQVLVELQIPENLPLVYGNAQKLEQVVLNLVSNAKYTLNEKYPDSSPMKKISITARAETRKGNHYLQVIVQDYGTGMTQEQKAKAFNSFFTTKPAGVGTGLGLSIVHDIIVEHGGQIEIDSKLGEYTGVVLNLPAYVDASISRVEKVTA